MQQIRLMITFRALRQVPGDYGTSRWWETDPAPVTQTAANSAAGVRDQSPAAAAEGHPLGEVFPPMAKLG